MITGEWFSAEWFVTRSRSAILREYHTTELEDVLLPVGSFLGRVIDRYWRSDEHAEVMKFMIHGYPVSLVFHLGEESQIIIGVLKRPISWKENGVFINCDLTFHDVTPLEFAVTLEGWREIYEKEKANAKN